MSKINELIKQLCPDGVEYKLLSEVTLKVDNIKWSDSDNSIFQYIDLSSVDRLSHRIADVSQITSSNAPSRAQQIVQTNDVLFGTTRPTLQRYCSVTSDFDGSICSTGFCVLRPDTSQVIPRWVFHMISTEWFQRHVSDNEHGASYPAISDSDVKRFEVPIPPLEVQREIVRILDKFTKLESELESELESRKSQYAYYRDQLLSESSLGAHGGFEWKTLGKVGDVDGVGEFIRGGGLQKKDFVDSGFPCIHYGQIYTHYGLSADQTISFVSPELATRLKHAHPGDLVIATTSENDEDVCKAVAWLGNTDVAVSGDAYVYRHSLNPKYMAYFFQSRHFQDQKQQYITGTKVRRVSGEAMAKIRIPVPSSEEQERVVSLLDRFDSLANDITAGLPAEIETRRKQYEHYRDMLLSFKEL
jgi:type I restriction enzyme S subunit